MSEFCSNDTNNDPYRLPQATDGSITLSTDKINNPVLNAYEFVTHTYEGSGGYADGCYLIKHSKEHSINNRKLLAYFKNYTRGILNSLIVPVFSDDAKRITNNEVFDAFITDVDNKMNDIQDFTKVVMKYTRLHGVCFVVMDNFENVPTSKSEAINKRMYPYMYVKTADEVHTYTLDEFDRINTISFKDGWYMDSSGEKVQSYRLWTDTFSVRYIENSSTQDGIIEIDDRKEHNLGVLPVIESRMDIDSDTLPHPPFFDISRMNFTVFNMDSEQRSLERLTAYPTLVMQSRSHQVNVDLGADSFLIYGSDYDTNISAPEWISPDHSILTVMNDLSNEVVQKLVESANVLGATAINTGNQAKSGVALSFEFLGQNFSLKETASLAEKFEKKVAFLFGLYINTSFEYLVEYQDNYRPSNDDVVKRLDIAEKYLSIFIDNPTMYAEIKKTLVSDAVSFLDINMDIVELQNSIANDDLVIPDDIGI